MTLKLNAARRGSRNALASSLLALLMAPLGGLWTACHSRPAPPVSYRAFVVNNQSSTLAAVDLATFHVIASLPTAPLPDRVLVRPRSQELYVVSPFGKITVVTYPHPRVTRTLNVGRGAGNIFSPDGRTAYVLDPTDREIIFLDCGAGKTISRVPLADIPSSLALTPDGKTLVVAIPSHNQLSFIGAPTGERLGTVTVGQGPGSMVILPDGSQVLVANRLRKFPSPTYRARNCSPTLRSARRRPRCC